MSDPVKADKSFESKITALLTAEAQASINDPERFADMVEVVARGLGFSVAMACEGDGPAIDRMMAGAENYAAEEAQAKASFAEFITMARRVALRRKAGDAE